MSVRIVVVLVAGSFVTSAAAARFDYRAPCQTEGEFAAVLQPLLPAGRPLNAAVEDFSVRIVPDAEGWLLDVRQHGNDGIVRQVRASDCVELVRVAAQIIALTQDEHPPVAAARLVAWNEPPLMAARHDPGHDPGYDIGVDLTIASARGLLPGWAFASGARGSIGWDRLRLGLGWLVWFSETRTVGTTALRPLMLEGALAARYRVLEAGPWSVAPQLGLHAGMWRPVDGAGAVATELLARTSLGLAIGVEPGRGWRIELLVSAFVPLTRPDVGGSGILRADVVGSELGVTCAFAAFP